MRSPVPDYLEEVLQACAGITEGSLADYIPDLASVDPDTAAIAIATVQGTSYAVGNTDLEFSIQSMSKPLTYALALADCGIGAVVERVGVEPSGEAFNEISLEPGTGRPRNPMINAGAIATHGLVHAADGEERFDRLLDWYGRFAGRELSVDEDVFDSEMKSAHRNLALGHLLAAARIIEVDPVEVVRGYIRQCAITVTIEDLALMAATFANGGVQPVTGERLLEPPIVRQVLSVMTSCGMYDAAGDWLTTVGIPAKSGVSGGILGVLPGQVGIAVFSPRLDTFGNSARGVAMMERVSADMDMHLMSVVRPARSAVRDIRVEGDGDEKVTVFELQGDLVFSSTESLIREIVETAPDTHKVVFDMRRVDEVTDVARRMAVEALSRLAEDGHEISIVDPDEVLHDFTPQH